MLFTVLQVYGKNTLHNSRFFLVVYFFDLTRFNAEQQLHDLGIFLHLTYNFHLKTAVRRLRSILLESKPKAPNCTAYPLNSLRGLAEGRSISPLVFLWVQEWTAVHLIKWDELWRCTRRSPGS